MKYNRIFLAVQLVFQPFFHYFFVIFYYFFKFIPCFYLYSPALIAKFYINYFYLILYLCVQKWGCRKIIKIDDWVAPSLYTQKKIRRKSFFIDFLLIFSYFNKRTVFLVFMHSLLGQTNSFPSAHLGFFYVVYLDCTPFLTGESPVLPSSYSAAGTAGIHNHFLKRQRLPLPGSSGSSGT